MIRTAMTLMLLPLLLLAMACDRGAPPPEPTVDEAASAAAVENALPDAPAGAPGAPNVEDLHTTQPVVSPPRSGPENPFGPAPALPPEESTPTGREQDIGEMHTTQPVQRPVRVPANP